MAQSLPQQSYQNHVRFHAPYHYFLVPVAVITIGIASYRLWKTPGGWAVWDLIMALALFALVGLVRVYPLKVQDRVIRLEERLRMSLLLPEDLKPRILELSEGQLVALRFASDDELPSLVRQSLENQWDQKQIKQAVKNWRGDFFRV